MVLFEAAAMASTEDGDWFQVKRDERSYRGISVQISGGTATVAVDVRNENGDASFAVRDDLTASEAFMIGHFPQMRVRVTAVGSTPDVRVSLDASGGEI